jgi:Protein of unknown function (DUF1566).
MAIMKKVIILFVLSIFISFQPISIFAETIEVLIKGINDGVKTNRDRDYKKAVMNAKLQAIERAGVSIKSITKVENFQLKYDMVESNANAVLLPGFQIIDVGYQKDGTYQIVLSGKVQVGEAKPEEGKLWGKLRSQPKEFGSFKEASELWKSISANNIDNKYVNNEDGTISDLKTGLMWMRSYDIRENVLEVKQYIEQLNKNKFAGYSDWRIPTLNEMASLVEQKPSGKLDSGRQSYLDPIFDIKNYCWYLWSTDRCTGGNFMVNIGEKAGGIAVPGDHYQSDGVCVSCIKAVRSMK